MGTPERVMMDGAQRREFLAGLFSTWYATAGGREKANAKDRELGRIVADAAADMFHFYRTQREQREAARAAA
jgi:hypothetical protein